MPYGRIEILDEGEATEPGESDARAVPMRPVRSVREARREIETLRAMNAELIRQIAALKRREAHAQRLADRDGLTGLYNRRKMHELLEQSIDDAAHHRQRVGLLFIDLDGFKEINDTHGHAAGDRMLNTVAARIAARARAGDFVCRYGGDEFVLILPRLTDLAAAHKVAESIRKRVALSYRLDGAELRVTAAIGVALYPDEARSAAALLRLADGAMYRMKSQWNESSERLRRSPAPMRRRDDKSKRRAVLET